MYKRTEVRRVRSLQSDAHPCLDRLFSLKHLISLPVMKFTAASVLAAALVSQAFALPPSKRAGGEVWTADITEGLFIHCALCPLEPTQEYNREARWWRSLDRRRCERLVTAIHYFALAQGE